MRDFIIVLLSGMGSFISFVIFCSPFYFRFGFMKRFYHDLMGWHIPKYDECTFDGCSIHCHCKHCGKEIMQDSQGNWF